ncbi:RtcB family protein [Succinatimonas hippei]|uniref:RtcB family protein n=1 Tax=Succinatimonas hippei TaxID=626938 RepID=UPI0025A340DB|nr:RtcB family protein [Succinatimonas hippei]MDM8119618.1 RtcB family protein [Succinatimonas hippei]
MITIENYDVKIFTDNIEDSAQHQIEELLSIDVFKQCRIRIMPDVHAGAGCVIGFTGDLGKRVIPNIVGVDIGCGILVQPFTCIKSMNFHELNEFILGNIPSGRDFRGKNYNVIPDKFMDLYRNGKELIKSMRCYRQLDDPKRLNLSMGSLGGGNHFIEIDKDSENNFYLVVHTGSRGLGKQVAQIYQKLAVKCQSGWTELMQKQNRMIAEYKDAGRRSELKDAIKELHNSFKMHKTAIPYDLCYLEGDFREDYLNDMRICQRWAQNNRALIVNLIMDYLLKEGYIDKDEKGWSQSAFESVHNYIGDDNIIRKGAIAAYKGQKCIIPLNMRDGSLICVGKGNEDWNYSAPHGAGRIMSRTEAMQRVNMDDFQRSMDGIYSESVAESTKDEAPMVYKNKEEIIKNTEESILIETVIKPIFNYKHKK